MDLEAIARAAVAACRAESRCREAVATLGLEQERVRLVGAGKAAPAMARGVIDGLRSSLGVCPVRRGLIVTKDGHHDGFAAETVDLRFAAHPEPDARSAEAGRRLIDELRDAWPDERLIAVISGGASSLLASPVEGLSLAALREATAALIGAGVSIAAINGVRKHLTRASGGRLAALCRAPVDVLVVSDVMGDDLSAIGSGPFAPDPTTFAEALEVAGAISGFPASALAVLRQGAAGDRPETPEEGAACFERVRHHLVASHEGLMDAAAAEAQARGHRLRRLPSFGGDVAEAAERIVAEAASLRPGEILLSGGEPTVILPEPHGRGGRNQQLALMVAEGIAGDRPLRFLALGSDGTDGPTEAAGAQVDHRSVAAMGAEAVRAAIERADAYPLLADHGGLIVTGPTGTNVLDLHLIGLESAPDGD